MSRISSCLKYFKDSNQNYIIIQIYYFLNLNFSLLTKVFTQKGNQYYKQIMNTGSRKTNNSGQKSATFQTKQIKRQASKKVQNKKGQKLPKYKIDAITKENFDISHIKVNVTQIHQLPLKYVLKCIDGLYKNRFLFITTHPQGQVFGSGDAKLYGLTLQIQGVGLSAKHAQLKYDGFKSFNVLDFDSQNGTWMNIPKQGIHIMDGEEFSIGPHLVSFNFAEDINQIEQICIMYHVTALSDLLQYNGIHNLSQLYKAQYNNFQGYPFDKKQVQKLRRICDQTKNWYQQGKRYRRLNINYLNQPLKDLSIEIGWENYYVSNNPELVLTGKNCVAQVSKAKLIPQGKVFSKIKQGKAVPLNLHSQIKIGNLSFQMTRYNAGQIQDIGFREAMQDGLVIEEDVGGSQWKLVSFFAVFDGHGGKQCMEFMKSNIVQKIRGWTNLLDQTGDLSQMVKVLMNKTFFQLDFQFYQKYPEVAMTCGATALCMLIIESCAYVFHVGDCKGYLFRNQVLYRLNLDHLPSRGDQRSRIQNAGGFVQYDRLMGKCTLSRSLGQFQFKNIQDYKGEMKGKMQSFLTCIPEMICFNLKVETDEFIILSTDGIFSVMDIADVTTFVRQRQDKLQMQQNPDKILSGIVQNCKIANPQSDNMAAILIFIKKGELKA